MSVLVGMVICSLMIGFVYSIYTNLNQITYTYQSVHANINAFNIAKADIKRELEMTNKILPFPNGFILEQQKSKIHYYVRENSLIKKQNELEQVIYETIQAVELSTKQENNKDVLISVALSFVVENQIIPFYIYPVDDLQTKLNSSLIHE